MVYFHLFSLIQRSKEHNSKKNDTAVKAVHMAKKSGTPVSALSPKTLSRKGIHKKRVPTTGLKYHYSMTAFILFIPF